MFKKIKRLLNNFAGAWIFYTTFPQLPLISPEFKNIAQFAPFIGLLIGILQSLIFLIFYKNNWSTEGSVLLCLAMGYLITGGLHIDGFMDTIDGIFAGKKRMLKAMKDSRVGSFSVQSIILITFIQFASLLKIETQIIYVLPVCLFMGRFSTLFYIEKFKYISHKKKSISHKKYWRGFLKESIASFCTILIILISSIYLFKHLFLKVFILISLSIFYCLAITNFLGKKVGGFNGDTCGASVVLVETIMLFTFAIIL
ncbi:MAG: cobalamin biosynthesis protein CobS [Prochlorococcus sp. SP3034]|nr:cobalamin biosynthesis protein CobS [Prochlorococcus sp. SP3034]|tara:strand:- start:7895 stop:8662 length:768 start_codon:yes stop_codon:yes gene_type:complete